MRNGINGDKSARDVARGIYKLRSEARAAKLAARIMAAECADSLDWSAVSMAAYADNIADDTRGFGPDADE